MRIIGIIPARYESSRFPGKPLVDIGGKSMIQRVYEQVKGCAGLSEVIVATDDRRIEEHVRSFAGNVIMTASTHQSVTERCVKVVSNIIHFYVAINIHGGEHFISPLLIELLSKHFQDSTTEIGTLVKKIDSTDELINHSIPKVIINSKNE